MMTAFDMRAADGRASRWLGVLVVVVLVLGMALPAGASAPVKNDLFFSLDGADCGGGLTYDIELSGEEVIHDLGDTVIINVTFAGEAVASDGTVIRVRHSWTDTLDFTDLTLTVTGVGYGTWVEGGTTRKIDRGRLVFDLAGGTTVFVAGEWTDPFDPHVLTCDLITSA